MTTIGAGPSKHTLLELNKRVDDLARKGATLEPAQAQQIATDLGVPVDEVRVRFDAQRRVHEQAVGSVEDAGRASQALRDATRAPTGRDAGYAGQATVNLGASPALKGANLVVPGEAAKAIAKAWAPMLEGMQHITERVAQGRLASPAADLAWQALAERAPSREMFDKLWSADGASMRAKLNAAQDEFARLLPNAIIAKGEGFVRTAAEAALASHITEAQVQNDAPRMKALASEYLAKFPEAAMAPWAKGLVDG